MVRCFGSKIRLEGEELISKSGSYERQSWNEHDLKVKSVAFPSWDK